MPRLTTINITKPVREELEDVKDFLRENKGRNPSANDAVAHLIDFWMQKCEDKGKGSAPALAQNSEEE